MTKTTTLGSFLTDEQINQAIQIVKTESTPHKRLLEEVIKPNMEEIDRKIGQENDAGYIAYAVEHVLSQAGF